MAKVRAIPWALVLALAILATAGSWGCAWIPSPGVPVTPNDYSGEPPVGEPASPGVYQSNDGATTVVGVLVFRDLEGGFWAIVDTADQGDAESAPNLAIVLLDEAGSVTQENLANLSGQLVTARGALDDGPSIYMAGPMLTVEAIASIGSGE